MPAYSFEALTADGASRKGIIEAGPQLAKDYMVLAQNAYAEDNLPLAVEMYKKAAPIAADGEAYLNLAKVLDMSGKKAEAKTAAASGFSSSFFLFMDGPHRHAARLTIGTGNGILLRKRHGRASLEAPAWRHLPTVAHPTPPRPATRSAARPGPDTAGRPA